jgi:hypothetical protein
MDSWYMDVVPLADSQELITMAMGVVMILAALVYLYGEIRAIRTEHHSFAVDPEEPDAMGIVRRGLAWVLIVWGLTVGSFMLFLGLTVTFAE